VRALDAVSGRPWRTDWAALVRAVSPPAGLLAVALPILTIRYQPGVALPLGARFKLQDAAVLAVLLAAVGVARQEGLERLRGTRAIWLALAPLLAWIVAATFYPLLADRPYDWRAHFVTASAYVGYALLAPALPLLLRRRADWMLVLGSLVGCSVAASVLGVLQWSGWRILDAWPQGHRQPSFTDPQDFAAVSGGALAVGLVLFLRREREPRLRWAASVAVVSGEIGFILGGSTAGIIGLVPGAAAALLVAGRRRLLTHGTLAATVAATLVASLGVLALRASDFGKFFSFLGARQQTPATHVESYTQRTLLAYIGLRIWLNHPVVGAGWYGSTEPAVVGPELPAAHRRFPDVAPEAFPGPAHEWGVQLLYLQALADLGIVGFLLLVAALVTPLVLGLRAALRAPLETAGFAVLGVFMLLVALGVFTALGFVAELPTDLVLWLAIGTIASAVSHWRRDAMMWQL
jgi:O-Antigen ligase